MSSPRPGDMALALITLKKRAEFLRIRGGARCATPSFVLETKPRAAQEATAPGERTGPRFGFTVTKQIGGAVERNRIKRRLRAAVSLLEAGKAVSSHDYVLIARAGALSRPFTDLQKDLERALQRVHHAAGPAARGA
jgi:ribonuclease P protein component